MGHILVCSKLFLPDVAPSIWKVCMLVFTSLQLIFPPLSSKLKNIFSLYFCPNSRVRDFSLSAAIAVGWDAAEEFTTNLTGRKPSLHCSTVWEVHALKFINISLNPGDFLVLHFNSNEWIIFTCHSIEAIKLA